MAAGIVGDDGVRHTVMRQLPGGERSALVARTGLVDPDMDLQTAVVRQIDRCGGRSPVDGSGPAGMAMREDVDRLIRFLPWGNRLDQRQAIPADRLIDCDVLFRDFASALISSSR